ncbi:probable asparagine synthase, glutamine-hydrolyzing [Psychrobacter arcticus 273-4]|uniref:asparagine synthase (glutamine-hydrolyzing) n=1 Tax=Psychrobacter arcticus (strain DSM 17307 / VKM B-2377 / 273-4) TaxID=259536 RepID=Q4FTY1_PSYA2|nr:asparagine synthase (glutamine-hydrolyzing) [Psychrobacter arcticus]AAZ18527.1 probable asparagine synthase, glutamine-hydrolyzing [Psychrobacter arcticus 273-4]
MCGVNGFFNAHTTIPVQNVIAQMNAAIDHRGPDAGDAWLDENIGLVLGHQRLAIQDLSPAGAQPMHSACGRYVLAFNGEIYNHLQLREQLMIEGHAPAWRGHSDTETMLACFVAWGIEKTLQAMVGMFAIVLWDRQQKVLTLARDRMGEKPLYWGWQGQSLYFSSELKGLKAHPSFKTDINRDAITLLLRHNCIPAPYSIYQGIEKLRPGHWVQLPLSDIQQAKTAQSKAYWRFNDIVEAGLADPFTGSPEQAVDALESALMQSIGGQMQSDVPLGAFLSGGIDSSTVVALMQAQSSRPVKTFTIGFDDAGYNEATHAKAIAKHIGTEHTEMYMRPEDALAVIPKLSSIYCEPFSDSSQIPTFLVNQLAHQHVTVALSGDGGDELFGGYNRYLMAQQVWSKSRKLPRPMRQLAAVSLTALSPKSWDTLVNTLSPVIPKRLNLRTPGDKAHKLAGVLNIDSEQAFYQNLTSHWQDPAQLVIGAQEPATLISDSSCWPTTDSFQHAMMAMDAQTYMTDDILVKVDRAAMANSLETRVPMLDHRIAELAWRMPLDYKIRNGEGKWLLKQVLYRHVPRELIERPKMGFGIPLHDWLRGSLRDWAEALLDRNLLQQQGYFNPAPIRKIWNEHLSGVFNHQHQLWDILMFQAWLETQ